MDLKRLLKIEPDSQVATKMFLQIKNHLSEYELEKLEQFVKN